MNKVFAFFGFIVLLIITLLTGGLGLILLLLKSESVRDFLAKAFAEFITNKIFQGPDYDYDKDYAETEEAFNNAFSNSDATDD